MTASTGFLPGIHIPVQPEMVQRALRIFISGAAVLQAENPSLTIHFHQIEAVLDLKTAFPVKIFFGGYSQNRISDTGGLAGAPQDPEGGFPYYSLYEGGLGGDSVWLSETARSQIPAV